MKNLKNKILELYPEFSRVYGPYKREQDGRLYVVLYDRGNTSSRLLAKVKLEIKLGRRLEGNETVDHVDEDPLNDHPDNLQVMSNIDNASKSGFSKGRAMSRFKCIGCGKKFWITDRLWKERRKKNHSGPFCSLQCSGKYGANLQHHDRGRKMKTIHSEKLESRIIYRDQTDGETKKW